MNNIEKFARIYEYVIGIDYDFTAYENKETHKNACSGLKTNPIDFRNKCLNEL